MEEEGIADDTVIVISTDHFPYGLDTAGKLGDMPYLSELYGYQVNDLFQGDKAVGGVGQRVQVHINQHGITS